MSPEDIARVETAIGLRLPAEYRHALGAPGLSGDEDDHPEFTTDAELLVRDNRHFSSDPEDLTDIRSPGLLGALKFFLFYGSVKRVLARRREWHTEWAKGQRFVIGSDLGEEQYYIVLSESSPKVYCYEIETRRSRAVAASVPEWLAEVRRMQREAQCEA